MTTEATSGDLLGVRGPVLRPGDPGFAEEIFAWNAATVHTPSLVVGATSAADVAAAVRHAVAHGLPVGVQATGHGAADPIEGGLLVTTRRMDDVTVDAARQTARVGAGVRWRAVIDAASPHGLAPLNGSQSGVGVVGFTLGGGIGPVGRTFGFAADHVLRLEVVTADGELRQVDAEHHPDLFWALRGGKGNFGIVTAVEFELMPLAHLYAGGIFYPADAAPAVLRAFRTWTADLPETVSTAIALLRLPDEPRVPEPLRGRMTAHLRYAYAGDDQAEGERLLAPMRSVAPALVDMVADMPYSAVDSIYQDPRDPLPFWERGILLNELTGETVEALLAAAGPGTDLPLIGVDLRLMGGRLARQSEPPNAVPGRYGAYSLGLVGLRTPEIEAAVVAGAQQVLDAVAPWRADGAMINFLGSGAGPDAVLACYAPDVRERLLQVKARYDPTAVFCFGHAIMSR